MKKIKSWLLRSDLELNKKWWHRLLKVIFIISIIILTIYFAYILINSYQETVNKWVFTDTITSRLKKYPNKLISIHKIYNEQEIISEGNIYARGWYPNLKDKDYLLPVSIIALKNGENYCSNDISRKIETITNQNNIKLFSTTNPTIKTLFPNINTFISYLNENSIKCVMIDSYTIEENNNNLVYRFLRPIDTYNFSIYEYKSDLHIFIYQIIALIVFIFIYTIAILFMYYKVILYIIYGSKK